MELTRSQIPDCLLEYFEPVDLCGRCYVCRMVEVFREVRRVLRDDGTLWLNVGDSYGRSQETNVPQTKNSLVSFPLHSKEGSSDGRVGRGDRPGTRSGSVKPKDLVGIPWMLALALRNDGWYLRSDIIWAKPNPMPESVTDRPTKAHEYLFLLSKRATYYYDADAIKENWTSGRDDMRENGIRKGVAYLQSGVASNDAKPRATDKQRGHSRRHAGFNDRWDGMPKEEQVAMGRNKRTVWTIATEPYPEAHFATFPTALVTPCVLAGCPEGGTVLDPFAGSGTTLQVAKELGRRSIGIELNAEYLALIEKRMRASSTPMEFSR